jgi:hypothetical protein
MWTRENRGLYERKGARYPSDLRDDDWVLIAPPDPAGQAWRAQARGEPSRGDERGALRS